nr:MAG TPA_asm: hypothetical protein [Caudoviricetes sp.]
MTNRHHQNLILTMQFLLEERCLQIWLPVAFVMTLMAIYLNHLVIIMVDLKAMELVSMVIKTHVLELAENVYC